QSRARVQPRDGPLARAGERGGHAARDPRLVQSLLGGRAAAGLVRGRPARGPGHGLGRHARRPPAGRRRAGRAPARSQPPAALRPSPVPGRSPVAAQRALPGAHVTAVHGRAAWSIAVIGVLALAAAPWLIGEGAMRFLSEAMLMLAMAQMWNLLA